MKIINIAYVHFDNHHNPLKWIEGSRFFKGIWEAMAVNHDVTFIEFIDYNGTLSNNGISYFFKNKSKLALRFPIDVHRYIAKSEPDVVMVHGLHSPLQVILLRKMIGDNVKIVVQHHAEKPFKNRLKKLLQKVADRYIDAYFFTAMKLADIWINESIIKNKHKVYEIMETTSIFTTMDKSIAQAKTGVRNSNAYIWVGHLNSNKNPMLIVRAFTDFCKENGDAHLYMIFQSTDLLVAIEVWLQQHKEVRNNIHLVGRIAHEDLVYWYNSVDFVVSTSYYEGSGVSVCEAMSCGCIPILSDIPSFQFMTNNTCGILYTTGEINSLKIALEKSLMMNKELQRNAALNQYKKTLAPEAIAHNIQMALVSI
jgi:glycosyltransferase involved in cell wall biosynthesis